MRIQRTTLTVGFACALVAAQACGGEVSSSNGSTSAGTSGSATGGVGAGGAATLDASDAALEGVASFGVTCNGTSMTPQVCPKMRWYFGLPCPYEAGVASVALHNFGPYPIAYIARKGWSSTSKYVPGSASDDSNEELFGLLSPGQSIDVSSVFVGGMFAIIASVRPFDAQAEGAPLSDEGKIPWPAGELSGFAANELFAAQLTTYPSNPCDVYEQYF